jgi:hypothetical protein
MLPREHKQSACWRWLDEHLSARLEVLRRRMENDLDDRKTARLRGSIAELRYILGMANEKPMPEPLDEILRD